MKIVYVALAATVLTLSGCGSADTEIKTQREAVESIRDTMGISVSEQEASNLMIEACAVLDKAGPASVPGQISEPPIYARIIMDNATQAYCFKHREKVVEYLAG